MKTDDLAHSGLHLHMKSMATCYRVKTDQTPLFLFFDQSLPLYIQSLPPIYSLTRHTCPPDPRSHICHLGNFVKLFFSKKAVAIYRFVDIIITTPWSYICMWCQYKIQCVQEREKQNGKKEPRCSPTAGHAWKRSIFCCSYFIAYPLTKVEMVMMLWRILRMPRMPRGLSNRLSRMYWMPLNSVH